MEEGIRNNFTNLQNIYNLFEKTGYLEMNLKTLITVLCILFLIVMAVIHKVHDGKQEVELFKLKMIIDRLATYRGNSCRFNEKMPPDVQIEQLVAQAEMLRFCLLCPLYQEKVQANTAQSLQEEPK